MPVSVHDMTFVLRAAGERTEGASSQLLRSLVARAGGNPGSQVAVIKERPFSRAVRRTFEIGLDAPRPWVVGLDADVLLLADAITRIGGILASADAGVFTIASLIYCKFYGGFCYKGAHVYPRHLLDRALRWFDSGDAASQLRPETAVVRAMRDGLDGAGKAGVLTPPIPLGVHDFEQSFKHIYLKMALRARRAMSDQAAGESSCFDEELAFVEARAAADPDFLVARWGLLDGRDDALDPAAPLHYDWNTEHARFTDRLAAHGLVEKPSLSGSASGMAERLMAAHDYAADRRTPQWVRDRYGFSAGTDHSLRLLGLPSSRHSAPPVPALSQR
jgi:hypothetical protein